MAEDKNEIENKIKKIEEEMQLPDFWSDKNKAQELLRELSDLKREKEGLGKYDRGKNDRG